MFPCSCSLRSTQCAALIALAAVAGLARIERTETLAPTDNRPITQAVPRPALQSSGFLQAFADLIFHRFTPASTTAPSGEAQDSAYFPVAAVAWSPSDYPPRLSATESQRIPQIFIPLTSRNHQLPFAVGPPAQGIVSKPLRVDGTVVPCDSPTRQVAGSRIAGFCPAETFRSSALRGDPDLSSQSAQAAAARAGGGRSFSRNSIFA